MTATGATVMNIYPQEDEDKNPVSVSTQTQHMWLTFHFVAHYRVRLLYVHGSSDDIHPGNA